MYSIKAQKWDIALNSLLQLKVNTSRAKLQHL